MIRNGRQSLHLPLVPLGLSLGINSLGWILLGVVVTDGAIHRPWLQFFPGLEWLTARSVMVGLIPTQVHGWWTALVFGPLFNFFVARSA